MRDRLDWQRAREHDLSLLWGTTVYLFGIGLAFVRWFKVPMPIETRAASRLACIVVARQSARSSPACAALSAGRHALTTLTRRVTATTNAMVRIVGSNVIQNGTSLPIIPTT